MSRASRNGIIVKGGRVLEQLAHAKTAVFDKTGTLTYGRPTLLAIEPQPSFTENELLQLVASAEQSSSHVLAATRDRGLQLSEAASATEVATAGIVADFGGREVIVGKLSFVLERVGTVQAVPLTSGELAIFVAVDGSYAGRVVASDRLRDNAVSTLAALGRLGVRQTMMLTGDAQATADYIAAELGLTRVRAECLPSDKVDTVASITERPVIMVGDGVNDAPVFAAADVGIAMGAKGSAAASESADVVIMLDDLSRTARAVAIGQGTMRIALQSI